MKKAWDVTVKELKELFPPMTFFFIALLIVAFIRVLMNKGYGIPPVSVVQIFIAALILGKAVLIADLLPMINRFPDKPLAFNVAWKTAIYFVMALFIHYLERVLEQLKDAGSFAAANERLLSQIVWPHFWALQIVLFILIFNYVIIHEVVRVLGKETMWAMFFGRTPAEEWKKEFQAIRISVGGGGTAAT